jgi:hypothetical protein
MSQGTIEQTTTMSVRRPYSTDFLPDIIPTLAKKCAANKPVNRYLENLVLKDAGRQHLLGPSVYAEAQALARIGSLIAFALESLPPDHASAAFLMTAKRAIFERTQAMQETVEIAQRLGTQEAWREAGGVRFEGYPEDDAG